MNAEKSLLKFAESSKYLTVGKNKIKNERNNEIINSIGIEVEKFFDLTRKLSSKDY